MKKKFADYPNWDRVNEKKYVNKYFDDEEFKGNICLLTAVDVKKRLTMAKQGKADFVILDNNYKWLEVYPENNKNIALSVAMNENDEIIEWYFDIAKDSMTTESGVPYIEDLYLDVILYPSGEIEILDEDELQQALDSKTITKKDFDLAYTVADKLVKQIDGKVEQITQFTNKYLRLLKKRLD